MMGASAVLAGCVGSDFSNTSSSGANVGCTSDTNTATFGGQATSNSGTASCSFTASMPQPSVSFAGQVTSGSVSVSITDAAGKTVYQAGLTGQNSASNGKTSVGVPGTWTITVLMSSYTGNVGIVVQG
jgi:hypothetical protein